MIAVTHGGNGTLSWAVAAVYELAQPAGRVVKMVELTRCLDEVLFCGVNTEGDRVVVSVSRLRDHVSQLWLALYTRDGKQYSLPTEVTLDRSAGSFYSAAGVRLQCLAPNRRWRVAFNGLLRRHVDSTREPSVESEVHVKLGLIWSTVSHTLEHPAQLAPALLAECCAEGSTLEMLRAVKRLATEMDSYDQAGMMSGEIVVDGEQRELCLWGFKIRNQGNIHVDACEEDHHFGFLENGDMYHLIRTSKYGGKNGSQQKKCSIPADLKHKIIEEHQLRGNSPLVSDIHNECSKVPDLTGGKGSSLAVLDSIAREVKTFSVPRGFIVTTTSYKLFSSSENFRKLMQEMEESMTRMVGAVERLSMPTDVKEAISQHLSKFDEDTMFAVRSSALGEDSEDMSAAGQMTTLLGLRGPENVINAVVKCWASQFSFTNVNYKRQYGQPLDVPMAVVVQELVDADTAGVMFTCDPLTGNPGLITVTANYGIGEIEKTYTTPQDIEWALKNGKFFMLQCRPVTTFLRESDLELLNEFNEGLKSGKEIFTRGNVSEVLPGAPSPLGMSLLRCAFEVNCRADCIKFMQASSPDPSQYMPMWGPMYRYGYFLWLSDGLRKIGQDGNLMEKSIMYSILGRDASSEVEGGVKRSRKITRWKVPVQFYFIAKTMFTVTSGVQSISKKTADLRLKIGEESTAAQIYDYMGRAFHDLREPCILLMKAALSSSFYNVMILRILSTAKGALDNEVFSELSKILRGTEAESADVPRMIQELGRVLRESPEKEKFLNMTTEEARHWLSTTEDVCGKKYREFIEKHGHRAVKEFDVYTKPWALDPSSLLKSLKAAAAAAEVKQAESSPWDASLFPYKLSLLQSFILKLVAPKARAAVEAREATKSATVRVIHQLRLLCHQLSQRMVQEGRLPSSELLFFLTYEEIGILLRTRSPELVLK
ncbi:hypothetical protein MTO96_030092 [Rhipicephalus appendiculatus]